VQVAITNPEDDMTDTTVIKGGLVVDGTGSPGFVADVRIEGDRVVAIGPDLAANPRDHVIDATGCVVAPGFIDIHTHYDAQVFWDPAMTPSCYHGVTTVVAGNCGFSIAPTKAADRELIANTLEKVEDMDPASLSAGIPWDFETFPEYLDSVRRHGTVLNFAAYIGHTAMRIYAMGTESVGRVATPAEVATMADMVTEAMDAGAAGWATSFAVTHRGADGQPIPSRWADKTEIEAMCRAVGDAGRGVLGINGGEGLSFQEVYDLQPLVGAPMTYTALLTSKNGGHLKALEIHRAGRAKGVDVWPQVSCRPLAFAMTLVEPFTLNINSVFAALMPKTLDERRAAYADPEWRASAMAMWDAKAALRPRWDTFEVMESTAHPELAGQRLEPIAEAAGKTPFDCMLDLALDEPDLRLRMRAVLLNDDVEGVTELLLEDQCTLGLSDAGAHVGQLCDAVLATDLLGTWVRERKVLSLEAAVHKLTQVQADLFGFEGRGVLVEGAYADVVVFDPATVAPGPVRRVRDFPADAERLTADQPIGMHHLLVNGHPVIVNGVLAEGILDDRPGRLVSPGQR
jgi:N-acyl-D-amino-acid deacylase